MYRFLKMSIVVAMVALPGVALATNLVGLECAADCDGFSASAEIHWASALTGDLSWTAILMDEGGVEVASASGSAVVPNGETPVSLSGSWDAELCGNYMAVVTVQLVAVSQTSGNVNTSEESCTTAKFVCDCPDDVCNFTPGYWKNHEKRWKDVVLSVGGVSLDQDAALSIMNTPVEGDATIILAYHLIAAKLNVLFGSDPSIEGAIMEADNLLAMYPVGSDPQGDARDMILDVKDVLADYNELGCDEEDEGEDKALPTAESSTWSELKANYR